MSVKEAPGPFPLRHNHRSVSIHSWKPMSFQCLRLWNITGQNKSTCDTGVQQLTKKSCVCYTMFTCGWPDTRKFLRQGFIRDGDLVIVAHGIKFDIWKWKMFVILVFMKTFFSFLPGKLTHYFLQLAAAVFQWSSLVKISHMARQLNCLGMCKIMTWSDH